MADIERIKETVRKLMAVAGDGVATDGEIDNAMRLAAKLMDAHHIAADEIGTQQDAEELKMGRAWATTGSVRFSTWESTLSHAICKLFGCVQCYISHATHPIRINGMAKLDGKGDMARGRRLCFYGPAAESAEAAELFEEWARSIATMGVARWGGCFRGDGAAYCYGFATALYNKAIEINDERQLVAAKPVALLGHTSSTTAITLADRYEVLRDAGKQWLKEEEGIHLGRSYGRGGYNGTGGEAYGEGRQHGSAAAFSRVPARKRLN
jgi:hypothetical protein